MGGIAVGVLNGVSVGFIGLNAMGSSMVQHIHTAGAITYACHGLPAARYEAARAGINLCISPADIASKVSGHILILMLSADDMVDVISGGNSIFDGLAAGTLIIDMSKTSVTDTKHYAELSTAKGAQWIDAPALGDEADAAQKNLAIQVGGSSQNFERALPILKCLGANIEHAGGVGAGQTSALAISH
jgi:2-hydroxy-3-oxopropionate reductase